MKNSATAIIADDEKPLRTHLRSLLSDLWPELVISAEAADGPDAVRAVDRHKPEIAFLDIRMPGLSGIEVAKRITHPCFVVFVTAYDRFAVEAFENNAVDYLLKPVSGSRLVTTVNRLKQRLAEANPPGDLKPALDRILSLLHPDRGPRTFLHWIRCHTGDEVRLIAAEDVFYFQAGDKYTTVMAKEGEFLIRTSIKQLEEELDPELFWKIHRGTIVNIGKIHRVSRSFSGKLDLHLKGREEILTVSRAHAHRFRQM